VIQRIRSVGRVVALFAAFALIQVLGAAPASPDVEKVEAPDVEKVEAPGVNHFSRLDDSGGFAGSTVGFGGATQPSAMLWLKREGFETVINLRLASEAGAAVEASRAAARSAGIEYIHLPFDPRSPEPDLVDEFLRAVGDKANQPVYIHCNSATRVAALWMIGRVLEDGWELDDAATEVESIAKKPDEAIAFASGCLKLRDARNEN
jgi:uncharacterized protein (TIGR01244 family)